MAKWINVALGDVTEVLTGFPFKSARYVDDPNATRLVRGDNIAQGTLRWDGVKRWADQASKEISAYELRQGDIVLAMDRPWIEAGLKYASIRPSDLPAFLVQRVARLRGSDRLDGRFLRYVIASRAFTDHVLAVQTGTAVPHISGGQIKSFTFRLPPLLEQRAIAHILGTLDDKIELNRCMNEALEAISRALFKSWFVDFDPVRAKAEGRDTGLPPRIATLFPDRFEESELGPIPAGWTVGTVDGIASLSREALTPMKYPDEMFDHYSIPAFDEGRMPVSELGAAIQSNKNTVPSDCVLLSKLNPRIPRVWLPCVSAERRSICSTEFLVAAPKAAGSREFLYCLVTSDSFLREFATLVTGTSGSHQRVKPEDLMRMTFVLPPTNVVEGFTEAVRSALQRLQLGGLQSRTLAALRDTLLPKLISGEIRVNVAGPAV